MHDLYAAEIWDIFVEASPENMVPHTCSARVRDSRSLAMRASVNWSLDNEDDSLMEIAVMFSVLLQYPFFLKFICVAHSLNIAGLDIILNHCAIHGFDKDLVPVGWLTLHLL